MSNIDILDEFFKFHGNILSTYFLLKYFQFSSRSNNGKREKLHLAPFVQNNFLQKNILSGEHADPFDKNKLILPHLTSPFATGGSHKLNLVKRIWKINSTSSKIVYGSL